MNCFWNNSGKLVYPAAAVGVVYDFNERKQTFFGGGKTKSGGGRKQNDESKNSHTDDITSQAVSASRKLVATGQNGPTPTVFIWDAETREVKQKLKLPKGSRLVTGIGISANDKYVACADAAEKIAAHVYDISKGGKPIGEVKINAKVTHLCWHPTNEGLFSTCGAKHIIWGVGEGKKWKAEPATGLGTGNFTAISWSSESHETMFGAGSDGKIACIQSKKCTSKVDCGSKTIQSIFCCADPADSSKEVVYASSTDKGLYAYAHVKAALTPLFKIELEAPCISIDMKDGKLACGMKNGMIAIVEAKADAKPNPVMLKHSEGEVWGLVSILMPDNSIRVVTSCDDNRIIAYNATAR